METGCPNPVSTGQTNKTIAVTPGQRYFTLEYSQQHFSTRLMYILSFVHVNMSMITCWCMFLVLYLHRSRVICKQACVIIHTNPFIHGKTLNYIHTQRGLRFRSGWDKQGYFSREREGRGSLGLRNCEEFILLFQIHVSFVLWFQNRHDWDNRLHTGFFFFLENDFILS